MIHVHISIKKTIFGRKKWGKRHSQSLSLCGPVPPHQDNTSHRLPLVTEPGATPRTPFPHVSTKACPHVHCAGSNRQYISTQINSREGTFKKKDKFSGRREKDPTHPKRAIYPRRRRAEQEQPSSLLLLPPSTCQPIPCRCVSAAPLPSPKQTKHSRVIHARLPPFLNRPRSRLAGAGGVARGGWRSTRRCAGAATAACAPSMATPSTSSSGPSRSTRKLPLLRILETGRADWIGLGAPAEVCWFRDDPVGREGARDSGCGGRSPRVRSGRFWLPRAGVELALLRSLDWISVPVDPAEG